MIRAFGTHPFGAAGRAGVVSHLRCSARTEGFSPKPLRPQLIYSPRRGYILVGGERGIRTLDGLLTHTPLAGERLQPLGHLSKIHKLIIQTSIISNFRSGLLGATPLAPAVLGSNPRWAFNPYALSRGARYSGHPALRPRASLASLRCSNSLQAIWNSHSAISPETLNIYRQYNLPGILLQPGA